MQKYGDPLSVMCHIGGFLTDVYEDARLQNLTVGEPKPSNLQGIHEEVLKKLDNMAHARQHDAHIGGYPIPFCVDLNMLRQIYTLEELCNAGIIMSTTNLDRHQLQMGWAAKSATGNSDITETKGACDTTGESTDTDIAWCTDTTLMISSNGEKLCLDALAKEQDGAMNKTL